MNTTSLHPRERDRRNEGNFSSFFPSPSLPFCFHPISQVTKTLSFFSLFPVRFPFFSFSASRIGTCRIHAHLINDVFNLTDESCSRCEGLEDERDSARRENQTLENEIQELKKKSEDYQRKNQALLKNLESVKEKHRNLELLSENLEAADKEQQEKMRQLQTKNEELEFKVTNSKSELKELLAESIQQLRGE